LGGPGNDLIVGEVRLVHRLDRHDTALDVGGGEHVLDAGGQHKNDDDPDKGKKEPAPGGGPLSKRAVTVPVKTIPDHHGLNGVALIHKKGSKPRRFEGAKFLTPNLRTLEPTNLN